MTFNDYNIVITGLGGQGLIRLLQILGHALVTQGYKVITSETHGLSQRGGIVTCFLRFGNKLNAPIPMVGSTDMIIALEESSIIEVLKYAKPDKSTILIISTYEKHNIIEEYISLDYLLNMLYEKSEKLYFIPTMEIALKLSKNLRTMNIVILGYILNFLPLDKSIVEESMKQFFKKDTLEMNLNVFNEGFNL
ncbi:MAG: 2-oxoacid:acceptor oxidoreductase family protein [Candidatus Hodarchaeota archaeon]